jgi:hypothetical protein
LTHPPPYIRNIYRFLRKLYRSVGYRYLVYDLRIIRTESIYNQSRLMRPLSKVEIAITVCFFDSPARKYLTQRTPLLVFYRSLLSLLQPKDVTHLFMFINYFRFRFLTLAYVFDSPISQVQSVSISTTHILLPGPHLNSRRAIFTLCLSAEKPHPSSPIGMTPACIKS